MTGSDAETPDPMHVEAAPGAVEGEVLELALRSAFTLSNSSRSIFAWIVTG
jgi:hypothetical protein